METLYLIMDILVFLLFFAIPIAGVVFYFRLLRKMRKEQVERPPRGALFLLFAIYGCLVMEIFMGFCWYWSGMASLGILFLAIFAPVVCGVIALRYRHNTGLSVYHRAVFRMAVGYLLGEAVVIGVGMVWLLVHSLFNQ
ncbi:MAG: hypothetical protein LUJ25_09400 [Firmicutes bacterium]|nr:hypothetical protein [Bacillota bacterium]